MSANILQPPNANPDGADISVIFEAVGLPEDRVTPNYIRDNVVPSIVTEFSDGEVVIQHPPESDPTTKEYFGETRFDQGSFGSRLRELSESEDAAMRGQVDSLIRFTANVFAQQVIYGTMTIPPKTVGIGQYMNMGSFSIPSMFHGFSEPALTFDNKQVRLAQYPEVVLDYGPGLQGHYRIEEQIADASNGQQPYAHVALSKGPFINQFLMEYWVARFGNDRSVLSQLIGKTYLGREDGIASATADIIGSQFAHTDTAEMADVVLASGIHTAGAEELFDGITNAYHLLRPDGVLLIRAPKQRSTEKIGSLAAGEIIDIALEAGFDPRQAQYFDTITGGEAAPIVASVSAVLRK